SARSATGQAPAAAATATAREGQRHRATLTECSRRQQSAGLGAARSAATCPHDPARCEDAAWRASARQHGHPGRDASAHRRHEYPPTRQAMNDTAQAPAAGVEDVSSRRLSFAFAKRHGVLVNRVVDGIAECIYRDTASPQALAEVRRYLRRSLRLERVPESQFDALLRQAYEAGSDAMQAVGGPRGTTQPAHPGPGLPP